MNLPANLIDRGKFKTKVAKESNVYLEIYKGMYGLPQVGILAQYLLERRLNPKDYKQIALTAGFWTQPRALSLSPSISTILASSMLAESASNIS